MTAPKTTKGTMLITILEDGTIKTQTDDMAGAAHQAADDFLKTVAQLAGGTVTETELKRGHAHHHGHGHSHSHADSDHHHQH